MKLSLRERLEVEIGPVTDFEFEQAKEIVYEIVNKDKKFGDSRISYNFILDSISFEIDRMRNENRELRRLNQI